MKLQSTTKTQRIYALCKTRTKGTTPADVTKALNIPAKSASDLMTHMAIDGKLRRVRIPNEPRPRYRYFPNEGTQERATKECWGRYEGAPIPQMPIVRLA